MSSDTWHDMWCTCVNGSHQAKCQVEEIMGKIKQENNNNNNKEKNKIIIII